MNYLVSISPDEEGVVREVIREYNLGAEPRWIARNSVGLVNKTFVLEVESERFVLRRLDKSTPALQLSLEVEVLRYLEARKYELSPRIIANCRNEQLTSHVGHVYMLLQFIGGEARVTMDDVTEFEGAVLRSFFASVAGFSRAISDFVPSMVYPNFTLSDYPKKMSAVLNEVSERLPVAAKSAFEKRKSVMMDFASRALDELVAVDYDELPKQLVHFDLHPGNIHYLGDKVVGIFDYDNVRFDCQLSELAGAIAMSCHSRRGGTLLKRKVQEGLAAYRTAYGSSEFELGIENRLLKAATEACIAAQALWAAEWYCDNYQRDNAAIILQHWTNLCRVNCGPLFN